MSEKKHAPTPRRLKQALDKGELGKSAMLCATGGLLGGLTGLSASLDLSAQRLSSWIHVLWLDPSAENKVALGQGLIVFGHLVAWPLMGALCGALVANAIQRGLHFNPGWLSPRWERVDPLRGLSRIFSVGSVGEAGKQWVLSLILITFAVWLGLPLWRASLGCLQRDANCVWALKTPALDVAWKWAWMAVGLGVIDGWWSRRRWWNGLRMSQQEWEQEHKQNEGDPQHKANRRAMHWQLSQGGPARGLQHATAVVVNPTHIAVALRYQSSECDAPYVVARAREASAQALREEAVRRGITVVQDIPLARSLVHLDVGEMIPQELYEAAAVVLRVASQTSSQS
jgi:type III secretion protein U